MSVLGHSHGLAIWLLTYETQVQYTPKEIIRLLGERYLCSKLGEYPALKVQFVKGMVGTMPGIL